VTFSKQEKDAELPYHLLPKHTQQVTFSKQEKDAELPYHLLPEHTQQAMIINAFSNDEKTSVTFRLIVGFIQKFQSRLQKDLVDLSLSNAFSTAKLDSISIKAKSNSAILIDLPMSQRKAKIHFYDGSSQNESSCASLLAAVPSHNLKFNITSSLLLS
jgi:hypothetical protein